MFSFQMVSMSDVMARYVTHVLASIVCSNVKVIQCSNVKSNVKVSVHVCNVTTCVN